MYPHRDKEFVKINTIIEYDKIVPMNIFSFANEKILMENIFFTHNIEKFAHLMSIREEIIET